MKDYRRFFAIAIILALVVFIGCLIVIPEFPTFSNIDFSKEVTGALTEGGTEENASSLEAGSKGDYNTLRSWGLVRGSSPGLLPRPNPGAAEMLAQYYGIYLGNTEEKIIYLTFDEGYENGYTSKILDVLFENKVNAIFFITGPYLEKEEALIQRMIDEGHAVGNHSINHKSLPMITDEEIDREITGLDRRFFERFGKNMVFLRPPKGEYSERSLKITSDLGYTNVFWSFAYDDWATNNQRGWEFAYDKVIRNLHNGAIILLHAVSSDNAEALDAIISEARNQGYEFGNVFDLQKIGQGGKP